MPPVSTLPGMHNGEQHASIRPRRTRRAALALVATAALTACTPDAGTSDAGTPAAGPGVAPTTAAARHFGPDRYGAITITMTESQVLATGELQSAPVSTVLGKKVHTFVGGPTPDPSRMAADEQIEKDVAEAEKPDSRFGAAEGAQAYAASAQRIADRLEAYLGAGGAQFIDGALVSLAAPQQATTPAGIRRGSTVAELTAAYGAKGLAKRSETSYELPVAGHPGWAMLFELEGDTVRFMSLNRATK